ncbi:MAG TPA: glycosyltransferase [Candidatus Margulisiibacteriota bacterium]|nr:glycosyltransferase [Candidatus Margulisiibacteriota bacterium]
MDKTTIRGHFNRIAKDYDHWKHANSFYYSALKDFYRNCVPPGQRVLELGCATGDILDSVNPSFGVGIDNSEAMLGIASSKHPRHKFIVSDAQDLALKAKFQYVIMCDLLDHVTDIWMVLQEAQGTLDEGGFLVLNTINPLWSVLFGIFEKLKLKMPEGEHNFVSLPDIKSLLSLFPFNIEDSGYFMLIPKTLLGIGPFVNRIASRIPGLRALCLCQYAILKKTADGIDKKLPSVTIVIPCFNEEGNVDTCASRIPSMAPNQEIIFVNDGSTDRTEQKIRDLMKRDSRVRIITYTQCQGKGHAVRRAFQEARGEILMILDADMSVMPEDLPKFYLALASGRADFVNGTRMIYPVKTSMHLLHIFGNKVFSILFSWLLGQHITDTLCGTKAFFKRDYDRIKKLFKDDPWGDFDFLLGAADLKLRIKEMPINYQCRVAGSSKMKPFKHGFILLLRVLRGFKELKINALFGRKKS